MLKKILLITICFLLISCVSQKGFKIKEKDKDIPLSIITAILPFSYDDVWAATNKVINYYNVEGADYDTGKITISGTVFPYEKTYTYKLAEQIIPYETKYNMEIHIVRLTTMSPHQTLIRIAKDLQIKRSFFTNWARVQSNNVQSKLIIYSIRRELYLKNLEKANNKKEEKIKQKSVDNTLPQNNEKNTGF